MLRNVLLKRGAAGIVFLRNVGAVRERQRKASHTFWVEGGQTANCRLDPVLERRNAIKDMIGFMDNTALRTIEYCIVNL